MFVGIGFVAVLTATVAFEVVNNDHSDDKKQILAALEQVRRDLQSVARASLESCDA